MKNRYILEVNSAEDIPTIILHNQKRKTDRQEIEGSKLTDTLLTSIEKLLARNQLSKENIAAIKTATGPGPYTSLRVGITAANLLAFSLDIPVFHDGDKITNEFSGPVMPKYGNTPNITSPKTRLK